MRVGLSEIAKRSGLSESTVSRVINRRPGVSTATRRAVEQAMAEVGYEGAGLRTPLVGIIVPDLATMFFTALADQLTANLAQHSLRAVTCSVHPGAEQELNYVSDFADIGISGVIFLSASNTIADLDTEVYRTLDSRRIPFVCINGQPARSSAPTASTDDVEAARMAVRHLVALGHRRIGASAGPTGLTHSDRRIEGFRAAMATAELTCPDDWVIHQHYTPAGGQYVAERLLDLGATAIVAASDQMALGAIRAARRRGLRVPEEFSVVGYDDSPLMEFTDPPLTTIRQPVAQLAHEATRALIELHSGRTVPGVELLLPPELIVRGSTAPPPAPR